MTELVIEQTNTEKLKQRLLELQIEEMEDFGSPKEIIKFVARGRNAADGSRMQQRK